MALNCLSEYETKINTVNSFSEKNLSNYIREISKFKSLTIEEEQKLAILAKEGSEEAKRKLICSNLKLVVMIAKKVIHTSKLPMIDLIQEGCLGLMSAVDKFNPKLGYRFATYAAWWVKQAMFKAISEQSYSVKIPVYIQETLSKYSKIKSDLEKEGKDNITVNDIAEKMKISTNKISNYLNAYKKTLSLEADFEMYNGSEVKLADIIEDKKSSVWEIIESNNLKQKITASLHNLKDREQNVITLRFNLNGGGKQTLDEIGKIYGVTKECIRQTESRALNKLKNDDSIKNLFESYIK